MLMAGLMEKICLQKLKNLQWKQGIFWLDVDCGIGMKSA